MDHVLDVGQRQQGYAGIRLREEEVWAQRVAVLRVRSHVLVDKVDELARAEIGKELRRAAPTRIALTAVDIDVEGFRQEHHVAAEVRQVRRKEAGIRWQRRRETERPRIRPRR